jgi:hypothetical protein
MGSRLMGSFSKWVQFFLGIQGLFCLDTVGHPICVLVNGIIQLMGSVCLGPKVIPLSSAHCNYKLFLMGCCSILNEFFPKSS